MLETIDRIRWSELTHAYGTADDVPSLIRSLLSSREEDRAKALRALWSNIFHQGTRYQATLHAIPFLFELIENPSVVDRHRVIYLLVGLGLGCEDEFLPYGFPLREYGRAPALDAARRSKNERAERPVGRRIHLACYERVDARAGVFVSLLSDNDEDIRIASAYALCWFPACATALESIRNVLTHLPGTRHRELANVALSYGLLCYHSGIAVETEHLRPFLDHDVLYVRVAAAVGMAKATADDHVLSVLAEGAEADELRDMFETTPFNDGDLQAYAEAVFDSVSAE